MHVATASGPDVGPAGGPPRVVGFVTGGPARHAGGRSGLGEGEIETLYVLDDWRERGLGRRLMRAAAAHLAASGCKSAFVWVLRDNPSRWFYERLGGRPAAEATVRVAGTRWCRWPMFGRASRSWSRRPPRRVEARKARALPWTRKGAVAPLTPLLWRTVLQHLNEIAPLVGNGDIIRTEKVFVIQSVISEFDTIRV